MESITLPSKSQLIILDEVDSTSSEIKRRAATLNTKTALWIVAKKQTDGYGRHGKKWHQKSGDFAGSLLMDPKAPPERIAELSFLVGLAVMETLHSFLSQAHINQPDLNETNNTNHKLSLKWPNDILLNEKKISGILLELIPKNNQHLLSIGIGINIVSAPSDTPYPATYLGHFGMTPSIELIVDTLDKKLHEWLDIWHMQGFAPIRQKWCDHAERIGKTISVRLPDKTVSGRFETINDQGCLILNDGDHQTAISAGEVFFSET